MNGAARHLGRSLLLDRGDIVFEDVAGVSRLREVAGVENLMQALELRVRTPLGSDRFNTLYGLDYAQIFGGEHGLRSTKELLKLNLVRTLGTDARVADVRQIVFQDDAEYGAAHADVTADQLRRDRVNRRWDVEVTLDTAHVGGLSIRLSVGS